MKVYLAKKNGSIIHHTDLIAMEQLDGISKPDKTVTIRDWEAAGSTAHIDAKGNIILGEPAEVIAKRDEISALNNEESTLLAELEMNDYQIIKAAEVGEVLAELDPKLHKRRQWCRDRINEVRNRLAEINTDVA